MDSQIRRALEGDLRGWRGLPETVTIAGLNDQLAPLGRMSQPTEQVRLQRRFQVATLSRSDAPREIEAWVPVGSQYVALVDVDDPAVDSVDALLAELGDADLVVRGKHYREGAMVREHVYASRGITLSVATPFDGEDEGNPSRPAVIHLQLFPPTTAEKWVTEIGAGPELHPFPRS